MSLTSELQARAATLILLTSSAIASRLGAHADLKLLTGCNPH